MKMVILATASTQPLTVPAYENAFEKQIPASLKLRWFRNEP